MEYNTLLGINVFVVCVALAAVVTLLFMIHENTILSERMDKEIKQIEKKLQLRLKLYASKHF